MRTTGCARKQPKLSARSPTRASIQVLLEALSDKEFDVRWLAAEGLIRIGRKVVVPLLETLVEHSDSFWLRDGIHHVLHDMNRGRLSYNVAAGFGSPGKQ